MMGIPGLLLSVPLLVVLRDGGWSREESTSRSADPKSASGILPPITASSRIRAIRANSGLLTPTSGSTCCGCAVRRYNKCMIQEGKGEEIYRIVQLNCL